MTRTLDTEVLVVGAGPVGLTLAMDLARARRPRHACPRPASAASRRASSATTSRPARWRSSAASASPGQLRNAGLPADYPERRRLPHHVDRRASWRASRSPAGATATPPPAARTPGGRRPSRRTASTRSSSSRSCSSTPRRTPALTHPQPHRVRRLHAGRGRRDARPRATSTPARDCRSPRATWSAATAAARRCARRSAPSSRATPWSSACSRPTSARRDLLACMHDAPAWATFSLNPRRSGNVYAIDGRETWLSPQLPARRRGRFRRGRPRLGDPHDPRRRRRTSTTRSSARRTGSAAASSPTASATGASSSAATPRTSGCPTPATA